MQQIRTPLTSLPLTSPAVRQPLPKPVYFKSYESTLPKPVTTTSIKFGCCGAEPAVFSALGGLGIKVLKEIKPEWADAIIRRKQERQANPPAGLRRAVPLIPTLLLLLSGLGANQYYNHLTSIEADRGYKDAYYASGSAKRAMKHDNPAVLATDFQFVLELSRNMIAGNISADSLRGKVEALPIRELNKADITALLEHVTSQDQIREYDTNFMRMLREKYEAQFSAAELDEIKAVAEATQDEIQWIQDGKDKLPILYVFLIVLAASLFPKLEFFPSGSREDKQSGGQKDTGKGCCSNSGCGCG